MSGLKRNKKDFYNCFYKLIVKYIVLYIFNFKLKKNL